MYLIAADDDEAECDRLYELADQRLDDLLEAPIATAADASLKLRMLLHLIARDLSKDVRRWCKHIAAELEALDRGGPNG